MRKIIMYGIGNERKFNHYIFEKTQESFETLSKLFWKIGIGWESNKEILDEKTWETKKIKKIFVKKLIDIHEIHKNK
ncbi:MAG: hypothetical protein KJ592_01060, partial [Nanoarchaeota archaeon]|nr:hypothetical protein [Nanoarchaeota archaeon]